MTNGLPSGWELKKLEDVVDILDSKRVPINSKERDTRPGPIPYYGATGQAGWIDDYLFDEELVLLGEDGAPFFDSAKQKAYVIRGKAWVNNHAHVLRAKDGIPNVYIKHYLDIVDYHGFVTGTTRLKLNQAAMRQIPMPVAPPEQQKSIVAEIEKQFSRLDEAVANLKRVKTNLKRYKAAVLKAAVEGRLVETEADLARRESRSYETGEQLLQRILETRRSQWKGKGKYKEPAAPDTTDLSELPEGWVWATVEQISRLVEYGSSARANEDSRGIPVLRMGNIVEGELNFDELKYLPAEHDEFPKLLLKPGDILFNRTNSPELVGKTAVFSGTPKECSFASYLIRVRLVDGVAPKLLAAYINSAHGRSWVKSVVTQQVGQANVNGTKLQALAVPLPPRDEQHRIIAEVDRLLSIAREAEAEVDINLARASRLRASVLQKAFSLSAARQPSADVVETESRRKAVSSASARHFMRALLSAEIVHRLHTEPTFGRVKHQKIFHLCEHLARIEAIAGHYHREAAGPLDNKLIYANEKELKKQQWYEVVEREQFGYSYRPLSKAGGHEKYLDRLAPEQRAMVHKLIELMRTWSTERCEIFSTVFSAWNDLLLWGMPATDDAIVHEILNRWHDSKRRIAELRWRKAIAWIRQEGFAPSGFGEPTARPTE